MELKDAIEDIKKTKCYESHTRVDYVEDVCREQIEELEKYKDIMEKYNIKSPEELEQRLIEYGAI